MLHQVILLLTLLVSSAVVSEGLKVLVIFPIPSKSHSILGEGYVRELIKAGHNVTLMTPFPTGTKSPLRTEIDLTFMLSTLSNTALMDVNRLIETRGSDIKDPRSLIDGMVLGIHSTLLQSETVQKFLRDKSLNFDVIVLEWFFSNILITLGQVFQCPVVIAPSTEVHEQVLEVLDFLRPPSASVSIMSENPLPHDTLLQRIDQLLFWTKFKWHRWTSQIPQEKKLYDTYVRSAAEVKGVQNAPEYEEAMLNISMALYNSHPSLGLAQSLPPNVRPVGGYHIERPTPPLPQDLQKIMNSSKDGVIYFSMGSILKSEDFTDEVKKTLLEAFSKLKQTIIWKYDGELTNKPKNVVLRKWLPQQSVLAHPNLRIFITHGGLLSTTEAIHFGVPLIGVPVFADQFGNMAQAEKKGYALKIDAKNLAREIPVAIDTMLADDKYTNKAKLLSSYYHDRPSPPGEEMVYWIEHVVRTKGAPHLRSVTRDLTFVEYVYLDLLAVVILVVIVLVLILLKLLRRKSPVKVKKQ